MRRTAKQARVGTAVPEHGDARAWLGAEVELIIRERERLLQTAGAAASLFSTLDPRVLPREARESARQLGAILQSLPDETLTDAMETVVRREMASPY